MSMKDMKRRAKRSKDAHRRGRHPRAGRAADRDRPDRDRDRAQRRAPARGAPGGARRMPQRPSAAPAPAAAEAPKRERPRNRRGPLADGRHGLCRAGAGPPPFVKVGDTVKEGDTLLIVEAMKTMNPILAPRARHGRRNLRATTPAGRVRPAADRSSTDMFEKILIANRGEIALRINRACKEMGIATVAVHSTADADAMHVRLADESVCIGPPPAAQSYLNIPAIIAACEITGAEAIHPGYGFLSENARFAEIVEEHGLTFIGPTPEHIRMMGDKIAAKQAVKEFGIPTVPGSGRRGRATRRPRASRAEIGYPVLIKAAAGGGGRGMKVARERGRTCRWRFPPRAPKPRPPSATTRSIWRNIWRSRATSRCRCWPTAFGKVVHLGERDCSLQRRHQKVWEEAPSPALNAAQRDEIGARRHARAQEARLSRRRHDRVPLRGRRVLFHRDEHAPAGRASGHRGDHRHRHRARADPHRRRRRAGNGPEAISSSRATPSNAASMPRTRSPSSPRPALITQFHAPGGLGRALRFARSMPAIASRPITTAWPAS